MNQSPIRVRAFACALAAVAGYLDAIGFLHLGGFFVSFMSGNTTRLGVGLIGNFSEAATAALLIALFVIGVMLGSLIAHAAGRREKVAVLGTMSLLLAAGALLADMSAERMAVIAVVLAMGMENTVFRRNGEVSIGLTYMTGTLVKLGQRLAAVLTGGERHGWIPYAALWLSLLAGAVCGAFAEAALGLDGLWFASAAVAMLTLIAATVRIES